MMTNRGTKWFAWCFFLVVGLLIHFTSTQSVSSTDSGSTSASVTIGNEITSSPSPPYAGAISGSTLSAPAVTGTGTTIGAGVTVTGTGSSGAVVGTTVAGAGSSGTGTGLTGTGTGSTGMGAGSTGTGAGSTGTGVGLTGTGTGSTVTGTGSIGTGAGSTGTGAGVTGTGSSSTVTGTGSTGPGAGSTGPGAGSTGPGAGSTGPGAGSTGPGAGSTGPGTGSTGNGEGSTGPGAGSTGPGAGSTGPGAGSTGTQTGSAGSGASLTGTGAGSTGTGSGSTGPAAGLTGTGTTPIMNGSPIPYNSSTLLAKPVTKGISMRFTDIPYTDALCTPGTPQYNDLRAKVEQGINKIGKNTMFNFFVIGTARMILCYQGSVIANSTFNTTLTNGDQVLADQIIAAGPNGTFPNMTLDITSVVVAVPPNATKTSKGDLANVTFTIRYLWKVTLPAFAAILSVVVVFLLCTAGDDAILWRICKAKKEDFDDDP